jgi:hypothetical protein
MPASEGVWFWEGIQKIRPNNNFARCFTVSIDGRVGRFVPNCQSSGDMEYYRFIRSFSNISVLQSIPLHCNVHQGKMIVNTHES